MHRTFFKFLFFLLYIELLFHIACFKEVSITNIILLLLITIIISTIITIITSISKNEKVNAIIARIFIGLISIIFCAELVYFSIYESFFSFNGVQFAGALKDGYDKILLTIFQNIIYIVLTIGPAIFLIIKTSKIERLKKVDLIVMSCFSLVSASYIGYSIHYINPNTSNSLYDLMYRKNLPILNVKKMGLLASTSISLQRKIFGFNPTTIKSEDDLSNRRTFLSDTLDIKYNIDNNIDLEDLAKKEKNPTIKNLHNYFSKQSATEQNSFTGLFKDKNVIFIMAESFDEIAIDKNLTPTLYKLKNEGIIFNNYFAPKYPASTADGEYMLEWATLPIIGENYSLIDMVYNTNPYILPRALKKEGYSTYVYHDYSGYYNRRHQYFDTLNFNGYKYCGEGIDTRCEFFHGSDMDMMDQTIDDYINKDKFFAYYITLSGHGSYDSSNFVAEKHLSKVNNLNYSYQIKYYLAANIDFDLAMKKLVTKLEKANKLDDTLIVISSDHSPYYLSNQEVNSVSKINRDNKFDRNRGSLIIYNGAYKEKKEINKYAMNIDVLPTVLNMLGIKYDSRIIIGKDIMAHNNEGLVIFPDRSWVNSKGCYDTTNSKFYSYVGQVDNKYVTKITNEVNEKYNNSVSMQYNDYYKYIFK